MIAKKRLNSSKRFMDVQSRFVFFNKLFCVFLQKIKSSYIYRSFSKFKNKTQLAGCAKKHITTRQII